MLHFSRHVKSIEGDKHLISCMLAAVILVCLNVSPIRFVNNVVILAVQPTMKLDLKDRLQIRDHCCNIIMARQFINFFQALKLFQIGAWTFDKMNKQWVINVIYLNIMTLVAPMIYLIVMLEVTKYDLYYFN